MGVVATEWGLSALRRSSSNAAAACLSYSCSSSVSVAIDSHGEGEHTAKAWEEISVPWSNSQWRIQTD